MRRLWALGVALALLLTSAPRVAAVVDPVNCTGYPEPRIPLEVQAWWAGDNTPNGPAHVHAVTCFPLGQTVSGTMRLDTRIHLHNNPGQLIALSTDLYTSGHGAGDNVYHKMNERCVAMDCDYWVTTYIDTTGADDGLHEIRVKPRVRFDDGRKQLTSTGWVIRTENGNPDSSSRSSAAAVIGRGWYDGHGYQNPDVRKMSVVLAAAKSVKGTWSVPVRLDKGGKGFVPTMVGAFIDPDFHHDDSGIVVLQRNGPFKGTLSIDTTGLANGPHRLTLLVQAEHGGETLTGVCVYRFTVDN